MKKRFPDRGRDFSETEFFIVFNQFCVQYKATVILNTFVRGGSIAHGDTLEFRGLG